MSAAPPLAKATPDLLPAGAAGPVLAALPRSPGVWAQAWARLRADRVGMISLVVVVAFLVMVLAAQVGLLAAGWQKETGEPFAPPHVVGADAREQAAVKEAQPPNVDLSDIDPLAPRYPEWNKRAAEVKTVVEHKSQTLPFGADRLGRDVLDKAIKGAQVSILVGIAAALLATLIGTVLGAVGGYFGGRAGDLLEWVYNVFTSVPYILLIFALAAVFKSGPLAKHFSSGIAPVVIILGVVGWTGIYRLVRAEYMKHRSREYVRAAEAIGAGHAARMFGHILPNVSHVILVQLSLHVVGFIKAEVILSFLGMGVPIDMVSWGTMLAEAQTELVLGKWWQLATATFFMATFVTAFALLTDALRDAMDPKLR
ncbi:ABC transporter permease [Ramlibacter sp.]|uniref:ABC transporter permease n=1 Tax=Ramlibacter sp. TaxID=1917967 RepID=UPI002B84F1C9|nr:ABC transporter permease [Ramlibacter sp.]HWI82236.1 ABC transporter permease [Ramlibacter sp.]